MSDINDLDIGLEPEPDLVDPKIIEARKALLTFLQERNPTVFYKRQLEVIFESRFFHWITIKALAELTAEGSVETELLELRPKVPIRFYKLRSNRYWKREANKIVSVVRRYSEPTFARAIGHQGELLVDAALPLADFKPIARNMRSFQGKKWRQTEQDLDRIVEFQGIPFGVEIKNTLPYIPQDEFWSKLNMCEVLGLKPLFISRMAPKTYIYETIKRGGISWILGRQFYPFGQDDFAAQVREQLMLPVDCPTRIEDGAVNRLVKALRKQTGKID